MVARPNAIPSSIVPDFAPQNVPPPIQDEHGNAMEDSKWVHKGSKCCHKVDACTIFMWLNGVPFTLGANTLPSNAS
jgi:hypothetical protein